MGSIAESQPAVNGHQPSVEDLKRQVNGAASHEILQAPLPNPSLQVTADHNLKAVDAPVYAPKAGEVLVHVKATGICGYDMIDPWLHAAGVMDLACGVLLMRWLVPTFTSGRLDASGRSFSRATASSAMRLPES